MTTLAAKALDVARSLLYVREQPLGSNRGPEVDKMLVNAGLNPVGAHFSWCMAFVYWCYAQAANELGVPNPLYKTAGVLRQAEMRPQHIVAKSNPLAGDIGIISHGDGTGHTFLVEFIDHAGIHTIEGNTNTDGSSNGIGVFRLVRQPYQHNIKEYLRF
jgi:hypothetical protein